MSNKEFLSQLRRISAWPVVKGRVFMWSPELGLISYDPRRLGSDRGKLAVLHELAHARLGHGPRSSGTDHELDEIEAWNLARALARQMGLSVDERYVRDRLSHRSRVSHLHARGRVGNQDSDSQSRRL